jgi:hypothetical protein
MPLVVKQIVNTLGLEEEQVAAVTTANARTLFNLD